MLGLVIRSALIVFSFIFSTGAVKTTPPVSIVFDGFDLETWNKISLWNKTRSTIVFHLNEFCRKDFHCDADYGAENLHLIETFEQSSTSIRLTITVDKPILTSNNSMSEFSTNFNYTALLKSALARTKSEIESFHENQSLDSRFFSTTVANRTLNAHRFSRFLFVLLSIGLVALVFAFTVFFFQRVRRHDYSKLLKISQHEQTQTLEQSFSQSATPSIQHDS